MGSFLVAKLIVQHQFGTTLVANENEMDKRLSVAVCSITWPKGYVSMDLKEIHANDMCYYWSIITWTRHALELYGITLIPLVLKKTSKWDNLWTIHVFIIMIIWKVVILWRSFDWCKYQIHLMTSIIHIINAIISLDVNLH